MNSRSWHQVQHAIAHGQTSTENRNNGNIVSNFGSIELNSHRSLNLILLKLHFASGVIAKIESDLLENSSEVIRVGVDVAQASHFVGDKRVSSNVKRHDIKGSVKLEERAYRAARD